MTIQYQHQHHHHLTLIDDCFFEKSSSGKLAIGMEYLILSKFSDAIDIKEVINKKTNDK